MIRQHSSTVLKHPKHGSGAMSIQGKSCNKIHENHDDQCRNVAMCTHAERAERASIVCSVKCRILRRISMGNAKTLTIVVRVRCLARRRELMQSIECGKVRV